MKKRGFLLAACTGAPTPLQQVANISVPERYFGR